MSRQTRHPLSGIPRVHDTHAEWSLVGAFPQSYELRMSFSSSIPFLFLVFSIGCTPSEQADDDTPTDDQLGVGDSTIYQVTERASDQGFYVARVNQARTRCPDGNDAESCHVTYLDASAFGLSEEQTEHTLFRAGPLADTTRVEAVWALVDGTPAGTFYRATEGGKKLIALDGSGEARISSVVLDQLEGEQREAAEEALASEEGLVLASEYNVGDVPPSAVYRALAPSREEAPSCGAGRPACPDGSACIFPAGNSCAEPAEPGTCKRTGLLCPPVDQPVCACNGETYPSTCVATAAGQSVSRSGRCPSF